MWLASDRRTFQLFRAGDRGAMAMVFDHYCDDLSGFLEGGFTFPSPSGPKRFRGAAERFDLHDLLSETFRRAFEAPARLAYDGTRPYGQYLRAIARNLVIDRLRSETTERNHNALLVLVADEAAPPPSAEARSPEERYQGAELGRLVDQVLASLDRESRRLIALRYQEDLSQEQAAETLKKTRRWVRDTEMEVRARLVKQLRGTGYLPQQADQGSTP